MIDHQVDVAVIGGGNAGLVAALSARAQGHSVLLLERAPQEFRGGNTRHTRTIRIAHNRTSGYYSGTYTYEDLWEDLAHTGSGPNNEKLADITIRESESLPAWMEHQGIRWQPALRGTLHLDRTNRFFLGGGKALINTYHRTAMARGVQARYETVVHDLVVEGDRCTRIETDRGPIVARAVVCASGGYEANFEWLRRHWGDAIDNFVVRGPSYNDGTVLQALYDHGAASAGHAEGFHAIAVDARAPRFDGGIATRLDSIPFSIVVNRTGNRFYDEGEDIWPKRYAIWGGLIGQQPDQIAYSIWDTRVDGNFLPRMYPPVEASTIDDLAARLGLDPGALARTVAEYNARIQRGGTFDPSKLDDCSTSGLAIPKSHWALPIDEPPFYGCALRPGITFTYMGVAINSDGRVVRQDDSTFANVFAAGEIMSGNILSTGYLGGFGLTIGTVWGRIAGRQAALVAHE